MALDLAYARPFMLDVRRPSGREMPISIGRYINPIEAHIVKGRIEVEGIPAYVQYEHHVFITYVK